MPCMYIHTVIVEVGAVEKRQEVEGVTVYYQGIIRVVLGSTKCSNSMKSEVYGMYWCNVIDTRAS